VWAPTTKEQNLGTDDDYGNDNDNDNDSDNDNEMTMTVIMMNRVGTYNKGAESWD